ncbi:hypothetical protein CK203_112111 [Vitis vinifera]|uniref:Uncharacterized protein n=1 Tax=Vitis vinifera TaxID=29760 RepID=A0A438FE84_VITVI|nr:hypothetical protein CK203_112111 [Vitis vinifera]
MPHDCQEEEGISASPPYQDPSQASQALTVPSSKGRVPSSTPQRRYSTQRPPTSPPQSHQYVAFHQREPGPWALDRHLVKLQSILRPHEIFTGIQALLLKSSSRHLRLPRCPFRAIQIVELGHFTPSFTWTWRLCDSSQTFGIHLDCSRVQRWGPILDALFRISEGFYFGSHHLIMATLLYFKEKDEHPTESIPSTPATPSMPQAISTDPPATPPVPPAALPPL